MISANGLLLFAESGQAPPANSSEHMVAIFIVEIAILLFLGRLLGELMERIGQPSVMGQLIAGIIAGPSIFGHLAPSLYQTVFPDVEAQKRMIDAISQLGILMLLLLTGMETDLKLVNRTRGTAFFTSISGIIFPFACGFVLGQFLPESMLPDPAKRLVTSLFLATALSISSVKIVAIVIMEVGFLRRNVGQIILASAILDDTIGWIIIAIIGGIASSGTVDIKVVGFAFLGTLAFLGVAFTVGRRFVAFVIRWTNDNLRMEMPVITVILLLMLVMGLVTDFIGVHTVLGAFVVGILVGQSPILTKHIEEQLRGLIVALFAPIFFAVAGREIDLSVLTSLSQIELALGLILIASVGKVAGCYIGGRIGKLGNKEATALAIGMNARGSTEVIVATIGLSLGVLNRDLFTLIVVMAISTTLVTPPLLRWALKRIPPTGDEKERIEREEAEESEFVPNIERILIAADHSNDGLLASRLGGLFAGGAKVSTTVLEFSPGKKAGKKAGDIARSAIDSGTKVEKKDEGHNKSESTPELIVNEAKDADYSNSILKEAKKGYDLIFIGLDDVLKESAGITSDKPGSIVNVLREFPGVCAIAVSRGHRPQALSKPLNILLPTTGTDYSQRAAEVAVALTKASNGSMTALHVAPPVSDVEILRRPAELVTAGRSLVKSIRELGERNDITVETIVKSLRTPETGILRQIKRGGHNLIVVGANVRSGDKIFFGRRVAVLLEKAGCPLLVVNSSAQTKTESAK